MWENMAVAAIRQIILTKTYKRKYARHFCMRQLRLLRHFVRNSLNLWTLQLYQVSQLSHDIFVVCLFFQDKTSGELSTMFSSESNCSEVGLSMEDCFCWCPHALKTSTQVSRSVVYDVFIND